MAPLSTFDLFSLVADAVGRPVSEFLAEFRPDRCYHSAIQFNMVGAFRTGLQGSRFVGWSSGPFLHESHLATAEEELVQQIRKEAGSFVPTLLLKQKYKLLEINAWGWPDTATLDFQEIWSHGVLHLYDNRVPMNFCEAVLRAEDL